VSARKQTALAERLTTLGITPEELAAIVRRPIEEVESWVFGKTEPDASGRILLRIVTDPARALAAELAAEYFRAKGSVPLRGEGAQHAGVTPPYGGGFEGTDHDQLPAAPTLPTPTSLEAR
jgi:hypothetical protein